VGQQVGTGGVHEPGAVLVRDEHRAWGSIAWLTNQAKHGLDVTVGHVEIAVGRSNPLHLHPNCTEVIVVLEGRLEHVVGDHVAELGPGDVLLVHPGVQHRGTNIGEDTVRLIVVYDSGVREYQAVN
jgi:mannose-6-phosphate isomerase-like protein (cupin superfamily)